MTAQDKTEPGRRRAFRIVLGIAAAASGIAGVLRVSDGELQTGFLSFGAAALFLITLFLTHRD